MFRAETRWLAAALNRRSVDELSPLLNVGSSTRDLRETQQPWTEQDLFAPLRARGVEIVHLDMREGEGIDIKADILDDSDFARVKGLGARAVLCCNILEHVVDPGRVAARCCEIVGPGGHVFVTVPRSYPRHRDPIDTLFRPDPGQLQALFPMAEMVEGEIVDVGESYRDQVRRRPLILFRHVFRFPFPFIGFEDWLHSMKKPYWLFHNYRVTCAVFRVR
jgi:hypothetical protein